MATIKQGTYGTYYTSPTEYLNRAEQKVNAMYIYKALTAAGWTLNAIAGILGNIEAESTINPGLWENQTVRDIHAEDIQKGFGLTQWTPYSKYVKWVKDTLISNAPTEDQAAYTKICENAVATMDANINRILYEVANNLQYSSTDSYNYSFTEFTKSDKTPYELACAFAWNYERSWVVLYGSDEEKRQLRELRGGNANYWYNVILNEFNLKTFTPRLQGTNKASPKNEIINKVDPAYKCYEDSNDFDSWGYGMPNCTAYAWGRFWEITMEAMQDNNVAKPKLPTGNAGTWFPELESKGDSSPYKLGRTPRLGAVICWESTLGYAGHVAVVEQIEYDEKGKATKIVTSESGWKSASYWWNSTYYASSNWINSNKYKFQGFIYNNFSFSPLESVYIPSKLTSLKITKILDSQVQVTLGAILGDNNQLDWSLKNKSTGKVQTGSTLVKSEDFSFLLENLIPKTDYLLSVCFTEYSNDSASNIQENTINVEFSTGQSYPSPATDIIITTTTLPLIDQNFNLTFKLPSKSDWGYWVANKNKIHGYDIYLVADGKKFLYKRITSQDSQIKYNDISKKQFKPNQITENGKPLISNGQSIQIGISTWTLDASDARVYTKFDFTGSNAIALKIDTHEAYLTNKII